jgi:hypothetical protein
VLLYFISGYLRNTYLDKQIWPWPSSLYLYAIKESIKSNRIAEIKWFISRNRPTKDPRSWTYSKGKPNITTMCFLALIYLFLIIFSLFPLYLAIEPNQVASNGTPLIADVSSMFTAHVAMSGVGFPILLSIYNYTSSKRMGDLRRVFFWPKFIIYMVVISTAFSAIFYAMSITVNYDGSGNWILKWGVVMSFLTTMFLVFSLLLITVRIAERDPITFHEPIVKAVIQRIVVINSRKRAIETTLDNMPSAGSIDSSCDDSLHLKAKDLDIDPGSYITDINKDKLYSILCSDKNEITILFSKNIGDYIEDSETTVIKLMNNSNSVKDSEIKSQLKTILRTERYDVHFGQNSFDQDYEPIYLLISAIEDACLKSIKSNNHSKLNNSLYAYKSIFYIFDESMDEDNSRLANRKLTQPMLNSLLRVAYFSIDNMDNREYEYTRKIREDYQNHTKVVVEHIYRMALETRRDDFEYLSTDSFVILLKDCVTDVDGQFSELKEFIHEKINKLESYEPSNQENDGD